MHKKNISDFKKKPITTLGSAIAVMLVSPSLAWAQTSETMPLNQVDVRGRYEQGATGYHQGVSNVGKTAQAVKDIPQAITIVPKELIADRNDDNLKDALRNVAGMTFNAGEGGRIGDNMNLRGFYSFGDLYMDGIRDTAQYNREVFNLEQIDVLRGSGSMLFGRGQAGGVINQVSKKPFMTDKGQVSGTVGSYDYYRSTADFNKVLDPDSSTAFRINALVHDAKSSRDVVASEREGLAPTLSWGIGTNNQITLGHYYLKTHNVPDYGVGFDSRTRLPVNVSVKQFSGTTKDYEDNTTNMTTLQHEYTFDKDTKLSTKFRKSNYQRSLWSNVGRDTYPHTNPRLPAPRGAEEDTYALQTDFSKKFTTGALKHELLTGLEYLKEDLSRWTFNYNNCNNGSISGYTLVVDRCDVGYGNQIKDPNTLFGYRGDSYAAYLQDMIEFAPGWKVLGGIRQDWLKANYQSATASFNGANTAKLNFSEKSYRSGLMFQPDSMTTYYLAWNDSFNATADLYQLSAGAGYPAERSSTTELGAKWDLFGGDLALRTALYRAKKAWERNTDLESTGSVNARKRHTDGLEFEMAGRINPQWEVFAGLALMNARIDEQGVGNRFNPNLQHNDAIVGMTPRNTPNYTYNIWSTYRVMPELKLGGGVTAVGRRIVYRLGDAVPAVNNIPSYARLDAMAQYDIKDQYTVKLNILNLTNKKIYETAYENGGFVVPGTKRAVQLTGIYKF